MGALTKSAILAAPDVKIEAVDVPEWGGAVCVRTFDGRVRDELEAWMAPRRESKDVRGFRSRVVALGACDESGKLLFDEADVAALEGKSAVALERVADAVCRINGLGEGAQEQARADFPKT